MYKNSKGITINSNNVLDKYRNNWKINDICQTCQCSKSLVYKIINKEGKIRPHNYKYSINHNYFDKIQTEEQSYILGFLCADGCLLDNTIKISLQYQDIDILEKIRLSLGSTSPIKKHQYKGRKYCNIQFYSKQLYNTLHERGCVKNKTTHLKWDDIKVPKKLMKHFIRGYFDGDGCLSFWMHKNKYLKSHWNITSTKAFILGLQQFIYKRFKYKGYISQRHQSNPNTKTIELSGIKQIITILNWLYEDATIYLLRKRNKYNNLLDIYGNESNILPKSKYK